MDINNAIEILEMLAAGCSPATGEVISEESVLNQRDVIRALQIAIDNLKKDALARVSSTDSSGVEIEEEDIKAASQLFLGQEITPSEHRLTAFFTASRAFKNAALVSDKLYGKYKKLYTKGQVQDFFANYFSKKEDLNQRRTENGKNRSNSWDNVDFFEKETFNNLLQTNIDQLKEEVNELKIYRVDNLSDFIKDARKRYPRAYEPWREPEEKLLDEALKHTNDVRILTQCFQRGEGAIVSCGKKLIFNRKAT